MTGSWFLYILRCADGTLYTGITTNVARRVTEHNGDTKGARYTRSRRPVRLERSWPVGSRVEALKVEKRVKKLSRARKERLLLCSEILAVLAL